MKGSLRLTRDISFIRPNQCYSSKQYFSATILLFFVALLHVAFVFVVVGINLDAHNVRFDKYLYKVSLVYTAALFFFLFLYPVFVMVFVRPRKLLNYLVYGYRWHLFSDERVLFSYPVLAIIPLDKSIYSSFKAEIPSLNSFWLDVQLYRLDRMLFLGDDPWRIFQCLISDPNITRAIDFLYHPLWISLLSFIILFHALGRHSLEIRLRFFLGYIVVWAVLGNALAMLLSSAGPCYYTLVTGQASPYGELMEYLCSITTDGTVLNAIRIQETLWIGHVNAVLEYGGGISAMPSLHIATTFLFALSMRNTYPLAEKMLYFYTAVIWFGSIHLGWHYASDGLVSVLFVLVIWFYAGKITQRVLSRETKV
ncbi:hypothetical protein CHL67_04285 [Prosthecochloris sp. GSB1]|uniref:phosphatase PAP2 family protein n=1 Tax=Prosthecochloris sp. GSB1 TaxID=281093 RepID=UPI000B8D04DD|nr:phosphatase PAP2 family protein [Prosthecochloris sp. GSB1]ASQ90242.1 hypothetical protein CHL67_04285 [Prosthecochloris sp. GSB1]